jgi:hypothetical protein
MAVLCCNLIASKGSLDSPHKPVSEACRKTWKEFHYTLSYLRHLCPTPMPVRLSFDPLFSNLLGRCKRNKNHFKIQLNTAMGQFQAIDVLVHEWAHAIAWNYELDRLVKERATPEMFEAASHDEVWGCAYARTYRAHQAALKVFDEMVQSKKEKKHAHA